MDISDSQKNIIIDGVSLASNQWVAAFNTGDAEACANCYEAEAVMNAKPFGTFTGTNAIQGFWQNLIDNGFNEVTYIDKNIEVIDANSAILTSSWKMNKAHGIITKEIWVLQSDGTYKLREDDFEALGQSILKDQ